MKFVIVKIVMEKRNFLVKFRQIFKFKFQGIKIY